MAVARRLLLVVALVLAALLSAQLALADSQITSAVTGLGEFQVTSGGFVAVRGTSTPTLEDTSTALFITRLYGGDRIATDEAVRYVASLENADHGYGAYAKQASDVASTWHAVSALQNAGKTVPKSSEVAAYVRSLFVASTGLFGARAGDAKGDVQSTAYALRTLEALDSLATLSKEQQAAIRKRLQESVSASGKNHFSFATGDESVEKNYYGVVAGSLVGFEFSAEWTRALLALFERTSGGFARHFNSATLAPGVDTATIRSTGQALATLRVLQAVAPSESDVLSKEQEDALLRFFLETPQDLREHAFAHLGLASLPNFASVFQVTPYLDQLDVEPLPGDVIVQGAKVRPVLSLRAFGANHAGVAVTVDVTQGGKTSTLRLPWSDDTQQYAAEEFLDTAKQLGAIKFAFGVRYAVAGLGTVALRVRELERRVGYAVRVDAEATSDITGEEIGEGELVAQGTSFEFGVDLSSAIQKRIKAGDYTVNMRVLDSSLVTVHQEKKPASAVAAAKAGEEATSADYHFSYKLSSTNIPAGALIFRFEVEAAGEVHSSVDVYYEVATRMVATQIAFEGTSAGGPTDEHRFKLGDKVRVTMVPASFQDLRTAVPLPSSDASGADIAAERQFVLEVTTPGGVQVHWQRGTPAAGGRYAFELELASSLDNLGANVLAFRYVSAAGKRAYPLAAFDSANNELFDDGVAIGYQVDAALRLVEVTDKPTARDFFYGNDVSYRFKVKDSLSGKYVRTGQTEHAGVVLSLRSGAKGVVSAQIAAQQAADEFVIRWSISPNAASGPGVLSLSARNADGAELPLNADDDKDVAELKVNIGGQIDVTSRELVTAHPAPEVGAGSVASSDAGSSSFVVEFALSCRGKKLSNSLLWASVLPAHADAAAAAADEVAEILAVPVAVSAAGNYQVSWALPASGLVAPAYRLEFFRETDRERAAELKQQLENRRRKERELAGAGADAATAAPVATERVEPLFTITVRDPDFAAWKLPFRMENVAILALIAIFVWLHLKWSSLTTKA